MAAAIEVFRENAVALRQTNMRFDAALSNMSQGLAMYDAEERLVVSNARLCEVERRAARQLPDRDDAAGNPRGLCVSGTFPWPHTRRCLC